MDGERGVFLAYLKRALVRVQYTSLFLLRFGGRLLSTCWFVAYTSTVLVSSTLCLYPPTFAPSNPLTIRDDFCPLLPRS